MSEFFAIREYSVSDTNDVSHQDLFLSSVDSETLLDSFRRLKVRIAQFELVSTEKYEEFLGKLESLENRYESDYEEYQRAFATNELTLASNPEENQRLRRATLFLEQSIDDYYPEYAYLTLKKRLEDFIAKVKTLYLHIIIKNKKSDKLEKLIAKASFKLDEIVKPDGNELLGENTTTNKEELVALYFEAKYYVAKSYIRYYFPDVRISEYFQHQDKTEYLKYMVSDLEYLDSLLKEVQDIHPLGARLKETLNYLKVFGYKDPEVAIEEISYFKQLFFAEDYLMIEMTDLVRNLLEFVKENPNMSEDEKYVLGRIILHYGSKLSIGDACEFILLFSKDDSLNYNEKDIPVTMQGYIANRTDKHQLKDKYYFVLDVELEEEKIFKNALKTAKIDNKIKEKWDHAEIYIYQKHLRRISLFFS